jgi:hypothetical protein
VDVALELHARVGDHHGAPAKHVARPNEHGITDAFRDREGLLGPRRDPAPGAAERELRQEIVESTAILRRM